jgi:glucose-fructose oxidoreductase
MTANGSDNRFREVEEMAGVLLRFPKDCLASFVCSFGAADGDEFQILGTNGSLRLKNGYEYQMPIEMTLTVDGKTQTQTFEKRDQFAPELLYFSKCILENKNPEPSGLEGLNDIRVIEAIFKSAKSGSAVKLPPAQQKSGPTKRQEIKRTSVDEPELVRAQSGSRD